MPKVGIRRWRCSWLLIGVPSGSGEERGGQSINFLDYRGGDLPLKPPPSFLLLALYLWVCRRGGAILIPPPWSLQTLLSALLGCMPPLTFPMRAPVIMKSGCPSWRCLLFCGLCWVWCAAARSCKWGGWCVDALCWADMRMAWLTFSDAAFRTCDMRVRRFSLSYSSCEH